MNINKIYTWLFLVLGVFSIANTNASVNSNFDRLELPGNIQNKKINCFFEDGEGFLWIGSASGLLRYDGHEFVLVENISEEGISNPFLEVNSIIEASSGKLWIACKRGLFIYDKSTELSKEFVRDENKSIEYKTLYKTKEEIIIGTSYGLRIYNPDTDTYEKYIHQAGLDEGISHNNIRVIYEDKQSRLWIGTYDQLNKLDRKNKTFERYRIQNQSPTNPSNNLILSITSISSTSDSILAIGTETGLCLFNTISETFHQYTQQNSKNALSNNVIKSSCLINENEMWLGTDYGLNKLDLTNKAFTTFHHAYDQANSICNDVIHALFADSQGNLWIGTSNGISRTHVFPDQFLFNQFSQTGVMLRNGIKTNAMAEDIHGNMWLATNIGLVKYNQSDDTFKYFAPPQILHRKVSDIHADSDGKIWIVSPGGLNIYDQQNDIFHSFLANPNTENELHTNYLNKIEGDRSGNIWIGSFDKGLYKVIPNDDYKFKFINFQHKSEDPNSLSDNQILDLRVDHHNNIWISTANGLNKLNPVHGQFEKFINIQENTNINPSSTIYTSHLGDDQSIWVAASNGVFQFDYQSNSFDQIANPEFRLHGLIVQDGQLWMSAKKNLYCYNPASSKLIKIPSYKTDNREFTANAFCDHQGNIFFNSFEGFITFQPEEIVIDTNVSKVNFTKLRVLDKDILPNQDFNRRRIITKSLNETEHLTLAHNENSIQIQFSSINLCDSYSDSYTCILEGYETEWKSLDLGDNVISYNNLGPGKYTFKVKSINAYGISGQNLRTLKITIKKPLWSSNGAMLVYFALLSILFFLIKNLLATSISSKNKIEFENLRRIQNEELINSRTKFYNNITHEIKTPISLIAGPTDRLLTIETDPEKIKHLEIVKRNARHLNDLVNQILDLRKIEKGIEKLYIQKYDIIRFCKRIFKQFEEDWLEKNIQLVFDTKIESFMMWFDMEKIEKVLLNLLSNAQKFTPENGKITLSVNIEKEESSSFHQYITITVKDSGQGIPEKYQSKIFDRFSNFKSNSTDQRGTGIGLSIVRDYTELHAGKVSFHSKENKGSEFTFSIPASKNMLKQYEEKGEDQTSESQVDPDLIEDYSEEELEKSILDNPKKFKSDLPVLLIAEDESDMRFFLEDSLQNYFNIILAEDGLIAWDKAKKRVPDIIISDVMMPNMDGLEFCQKVKSDVRTSHIPVILLTAKGGESNKMEGIETGADDYIQKPFKLDYLLLKSKKLIQQRDVLKKTFIKQEKLEPSEVSVNSMDEKFLSDVVAVIEKEMDNSELNVKMLSELIGMSHINFYRKIKGLTGQTAAELIRNIRIKRAGQLLKTKEYTVKEVMYMVGFTHRSYFSKSFKDYYGVIPKEYS